MQGIDKKISDVLNKYCVTKNGEDYYFGFVEWAYKEYLINRKLVFYKFRFTIYDDSNVDMWYRDNKIHTFDNIKKLEDFFKSLL